MKVKSMVKEMAYNSDSIHLKGQIVEETVSET